MGVATLCREGVLLERGLNCIMRQGEYLEILKKNLKTYTRTLELCSWALRQDSDPKHVCKVITKWLKDNKVKRLT